MTEEHDSVNHPKHYTSDLSGVECIEITRHRNFNIGNAIKYLWRAGVKDEATEVEDLRKAIWYIENEIDRLTPRPRIRAKHCKKCGSFTSDSTCFFCDSRSQ